MLVGSPSRAHRSCMEASNTNTREPRELTLQNEYLRVAVLPEMGGKIRSIALQPSGGELLQAPLAPYAPRTATQPFDGGDGGGWDECLPSIAACELPVGSATIRVPDHGDLWRLPWTVDEAAEHTLRMHCGATSLPLTLARLLRLEGPNLRIDYTLHNHGTASFPYGWSVHPLFAVEPYDRIHLPPSVKEVQVLASANGRAGTAGSRQSWPLTTNQLDGQPLDLSLAGSLDDAVGDKLVTAAPAEGWCALERKTLRTTLTLRFDPKQCPYLGLWICYGGWPEGPGTRKGYTVALEPCNLPDDSLHTSLAQGAGAHLDPGQDAHWSLELHTSPTEER